MQRSEKALATVYRVTPEAILQMFQSGLNIQQSDRLRGKLANRDVSI